MHFKFNKKVAVLLAAALPVLLGARDTDGRKSYLRWMQETLPECPEFDAWADSTGVLPPDFEALPSSNLLPDPFRFLDGTMVSDEASWERRRQEIKSLFEQYVLGTMPPKAAIHRVEVLSETRGEDFVSRTVKLYFGPGGLGSVRVGLTIPQGEGKRPVLIGTNLDGPGNVALRRGYISAGFAGNDFMDDSAILKDLYPEYSFAKLARRAYLVSIVLDYFETVPEIDMERIAIYGYSRDGKMATIAAAYDSRISALIAGSTGVGGLLPWRLSGERGGGESIESTTRMFPDWFIPELRFFSGREDVLPVDANLFLALIAPRAVLIQWGYNDEVSNGWAQEQAYASALEVYRRYSAGQKLGMLAIPGFHGSNDMQACMDFLDIQFGRSSARWENRMVFSWNWEEWRERNAKDFDIGKYPRKAGDEPLARSLRDWEKKKPLIEEELCKMLGESPVSKSGGPARRFGKADTTGPVEALEGKFRPGQLKPDVPAWVISRKIDEFGWNEQNSQGVSSKRISIGPEGIKGDLYYPQGTPSDAHLPTVVWLHGFHYPLGYMWVYRTDIHPILSLVKAGFAVLAFDQTGFGSRFDEYAPFYDRFPQWSRLGRMVDDVKDAVTALQEESLVDKDRISLYGFTMGGTVALYAAALDSRVANVVSVCGFTPMRSDVTCTGLSGMTRYSHLYAMLPKLGFFAGKEERLPYDYDSLIALASPRPVLIIQPAMDRDADPEAVRSCVQRARSIYDWMGSGDALSLSEPEDYARLSASMQIIVEQWLINHSK